MKKIFIILITILSINPVIAGSRHIVTQNPIRNYPYYQPHNYYYPIVSSADLSALEKYAMNKSYSRENPIHRLERLENLAFGSTQYGDIESRYKNVEAAILSRPNYTNTKRSLLNNVANYFAGQATGFTPSITNSLPDNYYPSHSYNTGSNSFYTYPSGYGTQRIDHYSNGLFGGGYNVNNSSLGNGSSIRILP